MRLDIHADPLPFVNDSGGVVRVGGTRVPLDALVAAYWDGATPESIADQYPSLQLGDIYSAIGYYLLHQADVEDYLRQRRQQADMVRQNNESRFSPLGVRERLLARRQQQRSS
jgi:uncharacterized protein (DUF433 family)